MVRRETEREIEMEPLAQTHQRRAIGLTCCAWMELALVEATGEAEAEDEVEEEVAR